MEGWSLKVTCSEFWVGVDELKSDEINAFSFRLAQWYRPWPSLGGKAILESFCCSTFEWSCNRSFTKVWISDDFTLSWRDTLCIALILSGVTLQLTESLPLAIKALVFLPFSTIAWQVLLLLSQLLLFQYTCWMKVWLTTTFPSMYQQTRSTLTEMSINRIEWLAKQPFDGCNLITDFAVSKMKDSQKQRQQPIVRFQTHNFLNLTSWFPVSPPWQLVCLVYVISYLIIASAACCTHGYSSEGTKQIG